MIAYKVLSHPSRNDLQRCSARAGGESILDYYPGQRTYPKFGRIFVFIDLATAIRFSFSDEEIWEVECHNLYRERKMPIRGIDNRLFWEGEKVGLTLTPEGTYTTEWVELTYLLIPAR